MNVNLLEWTWLSSRNAGIFCSGGRSPGFNRERTRERITFSNISFRLSAKTFKVHLTLHVPFQCFQWVLGCHRRKDF